MHRFFEPAMVKKVETYRSCGGVVGGTPSLASPISTRSFRHTDSKNRQQNTYSSNSEVPELIRRMKTEGCGKIRGVV